MPSSAETEIKNRVATFVQELDFLVRKSTLEALQSVLGNGAAPARRGPGRPRGSRRAPGRSTGGRPRSAGVDEAVAEILAHVQANDGQVIGAIADATGVDLKTAKKAALHLLASGQLKKSGQKRGTVYHVSSGKAAKSKARKAGKRGKRRGRKSKAA